MTEFDVPLLGQNKSKRKIREANLFGSFTFRKFKNQYFLSEKFERIFRFFLSDFRTGLFLCCKIIFIAWNFDDEFRSWNNLRSWKYEKFNSFSRAVDANAISREKPCLYLSRATVSNGAKQEQHVRRSARFSPSNRQSLAWKRAWTSWSIFLENLRRQAADQMERQRFFSSTWRRAESDARFSDVLAAKSGNVELANRVCEIVQNERRNGEKRSRFGGWFEEERFLSRRAVRIRPAISYSQARRAAWRKRQKIFEHARSVHESPIRFVKTFKDPPSPRSEKVLIFLIFLRFLGSFGSANIFNTKNFKKIFENFGCKSFFNLFCGLSIILVRVSSISTIIVGEVLKTVKFMFF